MRVKVIAFALLAVSGVSSANMILPSTDHLSYATYIASKDHSIEYPCGTEGQPVTKEELSDLVTQRLCINLRVAIEHGTVERSNYYMLQSEDSTAYKMGGIAYGCHVTSALKTDLRRYPTLCEAIEIVPNYTVFAFSGYNYEGSQFFHGRPIVTTVGSSQNNVTVRSFKLGQSTEIVIYPQPNFEGTPETYTSSMTKAPFVVKSFTVRAP